MAGGPFAALDDWRLIRRYAVPQWMIAECTAARERGDWRAACEAARVTVAFAEAGPAAELLAGFAPDLLRWHLPRALNGTAALAAGMRYMLAPDGPVTADTVVLEVRSPRWVTSSQRLTLDAVRAGDMAEGPVFPLPPYMWDARRAVELRVAAYGSATRPGDRLPVEESRTSTEPATAEAWAAAGWLIDEEQVSTWLRPKFGLLSRVDPLVAGRELRRVAAQFGRWSWEVRAGGYRRPSWEPARHLRLEVAGDRLQVTRYAAGASPPAWGRPDLCLHPALLRSPVDLDLVRHGRIGLAELHPLVRAALFPGAHSTEAGPAAAVSVLPPRFPEERVRVRCGAEWHWVSVRCGRLDLLHHTAAERRRELALRAFDGTAGGCFAAEIAWHEGEGAVPKRLSAYRRDLWRRMVHGGSRVVLALLDAGMDPQVRDSQGRTLLHRIHQFEHAELLPRLLAEGLDVNAVSRRGFTPMCEALVHAAPTDLLMVLNAAGAIPQLSFPDPRSWPEPALL